MIKIANAPCSWGALEFDLENKSEEIPYGQVLDEIRETGYLGTELGDWGYMPTDPQSLRMEISDRGLQLLGAFVPVALADKNKHEKGKEAAMQVAELMYNAGYEKAFIVLADENGSVPERTLNAGRIAPAMGLDRDQWNTFAHGAEYLAKAVREAFGIRTVFHHHCGGYVETPKEIDTLMELTDPGLVGLCLDTGHYAFGGGDPIKALEKYRDRIWHVHFKDYDPKAAQASSSAQGDYFDALKRGVFCELGKGSVDFKAITKYLLATGYDQWIVVEQDILPGMGDPKAFAGANREYIKTLGL